MPALTDLIAVPVVQAPMAGGASTPALAAEVSEAGGLGFLAAGYKTAEAMSEEIQRLRALTSRPFGVNLFVPQTAPVDRVAVDVYRERLTREAEWYAVELGEPFGPADDAFDAKVSALLTDPVPVVGFTFGCPDRVVLDAFRRAGTYSVVTVTSVDEAGAAREAGADAVCAQGLEAGGHQGSHRDVPGAGAGVLTLVAEVREAVGLPVIAAGGIMRGGQIAAVLAAGAGAAQLGTAFLVCPESGANALHKRAMTDPSFTHTELTRAFSGRPARGLVNRFLNDHGSYAPAAYPAVHFLTSGLRKAAAAKGDPQAMALWAGQGHRMARDLPAGRLVHVLAAELDAARTAPDVR